MSADIDFDLLDLIQSEIPKGKATEDSGKGVGAIDPLFEDAYEDFQRATNAQDRGEAFRLMVRLCKAVD